MLTDEGKPITSLRLNSIGFALRADLGRLCFSAAQRRAVSGLSMTLPMLCGLGVRPISPLRKSMWTVVTQLQRKSSQSFMPPVPELQWKFTSNKMFEDRLTTEFSGCKLTVDDGVVLAILSLTNGETRSQ